MALGDVPADILQGYFTQAEFDANPGVILGAGQFLHLSGTDNYKRGDGSTILSALPWRGTLNKTAATWTTDNTVLLSGQMGVETDTGKFKMGDGVTAWNSLGYVSTNTYSLAFGISAAITLSPADSTDYYFGIPYASPIVGYSGASHSRELAIAQTGTITAVSFLIWVNSVIGSGENSTLSIEVFSSASGLISSNVVSSAVKWDSASRANRYAVTGLNIAVTAGQVVLMKLSTPAWATNPTVTWMQGNLYVS